MALRKDFWRRRCDLSSFDRLMTKRVWEWEGMLLRRFTVSVCVFDWTNISLI